MNFSDAIKIIGEDVPEKPPGYRVHFERKEGNILVSDYFPEVGEPLLRTEEHAWRLAEAFAESTVAHRTPRCVNIYVVDSQFSPVPGYKSKFIKNR